MKIVKEKYPQARLLQSQSEGRAHFRYAISDGVCDSIHPRGRWLTNESRVPDAAWKKAASNILKEKSQGPFTPIPSGG